MKRANFVVRDDTGAIKAGATVAVYKADTLDLATCYTDRAGTTGKPNPMTTNGAGRVDFCAPDGLYDILSTAAGMTDQWLRDVELSDLSAFMFDVTTFGAKGDGATDDTSAVQAAIDAASAYGPGAVFLPAGTYVCTHLLNETDVDILGEGKDVTIIDITTTTTHGLEWSGAGAGENLPGSKLENLTIRRKSGVGNMGANRHGLYITRKILASNVTVEDFAGATTDGIHMAYVNTTTESPYFSRMDSVWSRSNGRHGLHITDNVNACTFVNCQFNSNGGDGVHHEWTGGSYPCYSNTFIGGQASYNTLNGYDLVNGTHVSIVGSYAENNTGTGVALGAGLTHSFIIMGAVAGNGTDFTTFDNNSVQVFEGGVSQKAISTSAQQINFGDNNNAEFNIRPAGALSYDDGSGTQMAVYLEATGSAAGLYWRVITGGKGGFGLPTRATPATDPVLHVHGETYFNTGDESLFVGRTGAWACLLDGHIASFGDGNATPSVVRGRLFKTANTGATTITMFNDGFAGQEISVLVDANTTIAMNGGTGANIYGNNGADWTPGAGGGKLDAWFDGTNWYCTVQNH